MKPSEYLKRLDFSKGWDQKLQEEFISYMIVDLNKTCRDLKVNENLNSFFNAVKIIQTKWESISNKIPYGIPEKVWSFFYASEIIPLKNSLCPISSKKHDEFKKKKEEEHNTRTANRQKFNRELIDQFF